ncbi:hypothetical protein D8I24_5484 (plasmid) [Cupriavidus necator H850]|nr:hypothetical protein D8I24_5484 [Cupriavidus necator H850]
MTIDSSPANLAAPRAINANRERPIVIRRPSTRTTSNHRAIEHITRPMLAYIAFRCAGILLAP